MPDYIALLPVPATEVAVDRTGFVEAEGLAGDDAPATLRPTVKGQNRDYILPAAYPTALCRATATAFVLRRQAFDDPLAVASIRLLKGLIGGHIRLRWVEVASLESKMWRGALATLTVGGRELRRIGLLALGDRLLGYMLEDGVPVLAGTLGTVARLDEMLRFGDERDGEIRYLLERLRMPFVRDQTWAPSQVPWMSLVEHIIGQIAPAREVSSLTDVRSFGPLRLPQRAQGEHGDHREERFMLAYAPGFVHRLAQCLTAQLVEPGGDADTGRNWQMRDGDRVLAEFQDRGNSPAPVALQIADEIPVAFRDLQRLDRSKMLTTHFAQHFASLRKLASANTGPGDLSSVAASDPCAISDLGRVVLRYAPGTVGARAAHVYSATYTRWCRRQEADDFVSPGVLQAMVERGVAFVMKGSKGASDCVLMEDSPEVDSAPHAIGELSDLGMALWLVFCGAKYDEVTVEGHRTAVYFDAEGEPIIQEEDDYPIVVSELVEQAWTDRNVGAIAHRIATLQRFRRSYDEAVDHSNLGPLARAAAQAFVRRVADVANLDLAQITSSGAGAPAREVGERPIRLLGYGEFQVWRDPFIFPGHTKERRP